MIRVILASNDEFTPFDLRVQLFMVNMELSVVKPNFHTVHVISRSDIFGGKKPIYR